MRPPRQPHRRRHLVRAPQFRIADLLLDKGQSLRADEPVVALTVSLRYIAQHVQASPGGRPWPRH